MGCVSSDLDSRVKATKPARETRNAHESKFRVFALERGRENYGPGPRPGPPPPRPPQDYPFCLAGEK